MASQLLEYQWREGSFDKPTASARAPLQLMTEATSMVYGAGFVASHPTNNNSSEAQKAIYKNIKYMKLYIPILAKIAILLQKCV